MSYDDDDATLLAEQIGDAWARYDPADPPSKMTLTGKIDWNGYLNPKPHRTTTLDQLPAREMQALRTASGAEVRSRSRSATAGNSLTAKGWHAQLRQLLDAGERGSAAADAIGWSPRRHDVLRWLGGSEPSAKTESKIHQAYGEMRRARIDAAAAAAQRDAHRVADALTAAIKARPGYGAVYVTGDVRVTFHR